MEVLTIFQTRVSLNTFVGMPPPKNKKLKTTNQDRASWHDIFSDS